MLVKYRGNIQRLAAEMNVAYNTARSRLDEIVAALGGTPENDGRVDRRAILDRPAAKPHHQPLFIPWKHRFHAPIERDQP
jgi:Protein of unknown function (DUF2089)